MNRVAGFTLGMGLSGLVLTGYDSLAQACSKPLVEEHAIESSQQMVDATPPSAPAGVSAFVWRRQGELCDDDDCVSNSCGDEAGVELSFTISSDDQSAADQIGYRLQFRSGSVPPSLQLAPSIRSLGKHTIPIGFDEAPQIDGEAQLVAIDRAGNTSVPSAPFRVVFNGCTYVPDDDSCVEDINPACSVAARSVGNPSLRGGSSGLQSYERSAWLSFVVLGLVVALRHVRVRSC